MEYRNYNYSERNYPKITASDIDRYRFSIVKDSYWNATNLKDIIEASYDTSKTSRLPNRKEEVVFSLVALVCELYLKSLVYACPEQNTIDKNHDLYSLFQELPASWQIRIKELLNENDFESILSNNKDVFINFRYSYEMKGYKINATFLLGFMNTLSDFCVEIYPNDIIEGDGGFYKCAHAVDGISYRIEIE